MVRARARVRVRARARVRVRGRGRGSNPLLFEIVTLRRAEPLLLDLVS